MCDSPVVAPALSISDSVSKGISCRNSATHLDDVGELRSVNFSLEAKSNGADLYRFQLEQDVQILQQKLQEEMQLHAILEDFLGRTAVKLSSSSCIPLDAQKLLSNISVLEASVSKLEQEIMSLHFQLTQERNERRLAEYRLKHLYSQSSFLCSSDNVKVQSSSSSSCLKHFTCSKDDSDQELRDQTSEASSKSVSMEDAVDSLAPLYEEKVSPETDTEVCSQPINSGMFSKWLPTTGLWDQPNKLSEEMVRCMKNIFISLTDSALPSKSSALENPSSSSSPRGHLSNLSLWSSSERSMVSSLSRSPQVDLQCNSVVLAAENAYDPYRVRGKLSWADIGSYGLATEVSWMSVGKKQLEYAAGALRRFRSLVEQLAKVSPIHLNSNEKLAFWINLYNALIMHAYLAYGVPRSELKLFSLMQKAAYTVGGQSFSAAAVEYVILKMKPPVHRPQIALLLALHKLKVTDEQRKFALDANEPLVAFALSCGMYSSPAVRIYTAHNVKEELQEAQRDFIRASVGVSSKGKLLVPKMLHCFARSFVDDAKLAVWISHYLPPHQAALVEHCISQRRQRLLASRNCGILPFDSRFRYLFLPDKVLL